jgi:hypothetical protein
MQEGGGPAVSQKCSAISEQRRRNRTMKGRILVWTLSGLGYFGRLLGDVSGRG